MKASLILLFSLLFLSVLSSQTANSSEIPPVRKNAVYVQNFIIFPNVYYDRVIPFQDNFGVIPSIGFGFLNPVLGLSLYYGNERHKAEFGGAYWDLEGFWVSMNYRYSGKKGLFLKAGLGYVPEEEAGPFFALGYCF